jgi:hypothetical protein
MRPSGRQEVIDLKNTLTQMLGQGGITEYVLETDMSGPSQMHKLISLVKKEQEIYNICFHELIRQVTVQCAERGALLSDIRQCYAHLLNSIPLQVKSLHDEIVAQRTLDKKLITELSRFHGLLTKLTYELSGLKDHNELAGEEIEETKEKLLLALSESEKNANLLVEYSHLYELQRKRLEDHIATTSQERELWECTCYKLAVTVADQHKLNSVEQLQLTGRSWEKLATHFTITLSDVDTKQLCIIQSEIHQWKNDLAQFVRLLNETENNINTKLNTVYEDMNLWFVKLKQLRSESGSTADVLDRDGILELWQAMTYWLTTLNELSDMFSGEKLLNFQEQLHQVDQRMDKWKEIALTIMKRHIKPSAVNNQTESSDELQESTTVLVQRINSFMKHLSTRGSGENGIAIAFVRLITPMESWDTQFNLITGCSGKSFTETDYTKFVSQVESWLDLLSSSSTIITTNNNSHQQEDINTIVTLTDKWCSMVCHSIQHEDSQIIDYVTRLHSSLVQWMANMLLSLATKSTDPETTSDLKTNCQVLNDSLTTFTSKVSSSSYLVYDGSVLDYSQDEVHVLEEQDKIENLIDEANNWTRLSKILVESLEQIANDDTTLTTTDSSVRVIDDEEEQIHYDSSTAKVLTIGEDDNVTEIIPELIFNETSEDQLDLEKLEGLPEGRGVFKQDAEKLVLELDEQKMLLKEQIEKTKFEMERADKAESRLKESQDMIDKLTAELAQNKLELQEQTAKNNIKKPPTTKGPRQKQDNKKR